MGTAIRRIAAADGPLLVALNRASADFHAPWAAPPRTQAEFAAYAGKLAAGTAIGFLLLAPDGAPVGVVNVNNPVWGALRGASLGYYAFSGQAGRGLFSAGLALVIGEAFSGLGLHRLEANVQPGNAASLRCIRRLGFEREGFSRRFLMIGGEWRDHERWALLAEDWPGERISRGHRGSR